MDGDGTAEVVFSEADASAEVRVAVVRGADASIPRSATQWEDATWRFSSPRTCTDADGEAVPCEHLLAFSAGDTDGDAREEVALVAADNDPYGHRWRFGLVSLSGVGACDFSLDDALLAPAGISAADIPGLGAGSTPEVGARVLAANDLDGDGLGDVVVLGPAANLEAPRMAAWFLYGGSDWLTGGGDLMVNPDRVEFPAIGDFRAVDSIGPDSEGSTVLDLDADGIDEVAIGMGHALPVGDSRVFTLVVPGSVGGLRGVHEWDDPALYAIVADDERHLMAVPGRGDHDGDGIEDLVMMSYDPYHDDVQQLDAWILYGGTLPIPPSR